MPCPKLLHQVTNQIADTSLLHIGDLLDILIQVRHHRQAYPLFYLPVLLGTDPPAPGGHWRTFDDAANYDEAAKV